MNKLLRAIKAKNLEKIRAAIESGEDVNGRDAKNRLPLSIAATSGDGPTVEELLRHGADPEGTDAEAMSPLYKCIAFGNVDGAKALIAAGANVEHSAPGVWTPLQKCAYDGFVDVLDALLEAGANPNRVVKEMSPLAMAWWGHPRDPARYERLIERLRAAGAEVDATAREWASKRAATTGGTSASAIAPSADGFTFSLFERTKAWIELFSSRRDVKRRTKLEIGEPVEPQMTHRTYPSDAQQFAAHASTFHFAYEAKAPPPPPPPAAFGPEPRFALELAKVVEGEPSFGEWTRAGDAFLFASGRFGDPCVMACDLEGNLLWKTPVAKTPRWIAATATHAVVATRDYLDESASAYEWLDSRDGRPRGTHAGVASERRGRRGRHGLRHRLPARRAGDRDGAARRPHGATAPAAAACEDLPGPRVRGARHRRRRLHRDRAGALPRRTAGVGDPRHAARSRRR